MSNWIHLNLLFRDYNETIERLQKDAAPQRKPSGIYKELISYLKEIVDSLLPKINRYFYFFEPNPHLFLALEVRDMYDIDSIMSKINQIKKPHFIESTAIDSTSGIGDEGNGEAAIDFFYAATKYAFFRIGDDYEPKYEKNDEVKLVHCFCNQLFFSIQNERKFYSKRLEVL